MTAAGGRVAGVVLAAGAGSRYGMPKALIREPSGEHWGARAAAVLAAGGCDEVLVVVGAEADAVARTLPSWCRVVPCADWAEGLSASLRAGLEAASEVPDVRCAVVALVDTPGMSSAAVHRVLDAGSGGAGSLARAAHDGVAGHPVLIGAAHFAAIAAEVRGDRGAAGYLERHGALLVECGDVSDGRDVDVPEGHAVPGQEAP